MSVRQADRSTLERHEDLSFTHRPAIDGLRAIAALLVVLFHAGMPGMDDGFVGVDVCFVPSGFLITSLVVRDRLVSGHVNFAQEAAPSPVQHYWSLSVEEQFYLLWPLVLGALLAFSLIRRRLAPLVPAVVAVVAALLSAALSRADLMEAHFGTPGRAHQLLCGAALGVAFLWWRRRRTLDLTVGKASDPPVAVASVAMAGGSWC